MSSSSSLAGPNGRDEGPGPALPIFESIKNHSSQHAGRAESSASGSGRSGSEERQNSPVNTRDSLSSFRGSIHDQQDGQDVLHPFRRRSYRNSGGFLLDPISRSSLSRTMLTKSRQDPKGKRRSEESDLSIPKRRLRTSHARPNSSIGSSPLATEVKPDIILSEGSANGGIVRGTDVRHPPIPPAQSLTFHNHPDEPIHLKRPHPPRVGYDTDPTQIVNMALSLSEGRRRQASSKRYASGDQHGNRVVSTTATTSPHVRPTAGNPAQYLTPIRQVSRTVSPDLRPTTAQSGGIVSLNSPIALTQDDEQDVDMEDHLDEQISRATQARVQKAKTFFELAYEHRRLLSHLPPIRRPGLQSRASTSEESSKVYNPLQYIRNRKLRVWDKTAIHAEADGWCDIVKVRNWVDTVIQAHRDTRHDPDECVRLPPLSKSPSNTGESEPDTQKRKSTTRTGDQQPTKPRRPRSDWETYPGDMIADCFWLEQGMNKVKIQDKDNNQIYPPDTHFKFSGWRNRTPVDVPQALQSPTPPPEEIEKQGIEDRPLSSPLPELPAFRSTARGKSDRNKAKNTEKSRKGRKGLKMFINDSESASSSSAFESDDDQRGRKRFSRKRQKVVGSKNNDQLTDLLPRDSFSPYRLSLDDNSQPSSAYNSKRPSIDNSRLSRLLKREGSRSGSSKNRSQPRAQSLQADRGSRNRNIENEYPRSSFENDSTAPNSPLAVRWPSIAINLESPAPSRSPSPTKKPRPSSLRPFRERIHNGQDKVVSTDFAATNSNRSSGNASSDNERKRDSSTDFSRGTSPMTRGFSPTDRAESPFSKDRALSTHFEPTYPSADHRASTVSRVSTRTNASAGDHSRIRGIFKGGRIAEIVGNEVSRVGDYIWKRDIPHTVRNHGSVSDESIRSFESDYETQARPNGHLHKTPPQPGLRSRSSTLSSVKSEKISPPPGRESVTSGDKIKYHNPNLPTFTSPFQEDRDRRERMKDFLAPDGSPPPDHISRMAAQHRSASRSPRLEQIGLPKIITTQPSRPDGSKRQHSYGFSSGLDVRKPQDASDKFNSAINGSLQPGATGLRTSRSAGDLTRPIEVTRKASIQEANDIPVTRRDITRAEALILSSAIKAREIGRRADAPRIRAPKYLRQTIDASNADLHTVALSQIRRREEHVFAARNIMGTLSGHATQFNASLEHFTGRLAPLLYTELQNLEDLVENKMTPRVRVTADEAGDLSMKLTTTSTLAVKDVNDAIDNAFRRKRRGPVRWVRAALYKSIEWAVVALLWAIWAAVTFVRLILGILNGVKVTIRWLFWIE